MSSDFFIDDERIAWRAVGPMHKVIFSSHALDRRNRKICVSCKRPIHNITAKTQRAGKKMVTQERNGVTFFLHASCERRERGSESA